MRTAASVLVFLLIGGVAAADPLWQAEVRVGYGVAIVSGDGMTAPRSAPLTLEGVGALKINEEPNIWAYGGFIVETLGRNSLGATGGVQTQWGGMRLRAGGVFIAAPFTLGGGEAALGTCLAPGHGRHVCGDLQVTEYAFGSDLASGKAETQVQLVLGMVFDGA